ncbi:MAG TPA: uracil-DNA glycosylase [Firmicutes bacterium]|jgi:uracil-DNA glycosylase|nr:uracil-DNA glycosylase [Bacillota bacterium]
MNSHFTNWETFFKQENKLDYARNLHAFLDEEYAKHTVYPPRNLLFNAFKLTPLEQVKVIIIGQDPYHEPGQAMGLSFSVPKGVPSPMSLINIYKEIEQDLQVTMNYELGDLTSWARQGVLLLNAYLSVRRSDALSHRHPGYDQFFEHVLHLLNEIDRPLVFMLWGAFARKYKRVLNNSQHLILESVHPSPLAANRGGWFGNKHFSKANAFLKSQGLEQITWQNNIG